ncbi:MAG: M20 family metallopeptidase, partial [Pseudomonadota bacterium]|nr:M20 family metallopeptidase [Pseudomonadota bacterium]
MIANAPDPVELTRQLVRIDTTNPPGNEEAALAPLAELLSAHGFEIAWHRFAPGRANLVASFPGREAGPFLGFTGHVDTVPIGETPWRHQPFEAREEGGRLFGRGSTDMKSGIAAIVCAAVDSARAGKLRRGVALILTAGEEHGCEGALRLCRDGFPVPPLAGLVVAEPTSNRLSLGHKGALFLRVTARGVTAHSSMPHEGDNAIYRLAEAVLKVRDLTFDTEPHPVLGMPTKNVGLIAGGHAPNAVPDLASMTMDIRSVPGQSHAGLVRDLTQHLGEGLSVEVVHDLDPVWTDQDNPLVDLCRAALSAAGSRVEEPIGMPFFTDASVLAPMTRAPVVIIGPGEATQAHKTDEWCRTEEISRSRDIYLRLIESFGIRG